MPVAIADTTIYSTVQAISDPMMAMGMSRCGFLASCAAVVTESNPMYAKNTIAAPATTPLNPKCSRAPVLGGMNGCQLSGFTCEAARAMKSRTTATLIKTMTLFTEADSLIPTTRSVVITAMMNTAGKLSNAVA